MDDGTKVSILALSEIVNINHDLSEHKYKTLDEYNDIPLMNGSKLGATQKRLFVSNNEIANCCHILKESSQQKI